MCGPHRRRPATEEDDPDAIDDNGNANPNANSNASPSQFSVLLSALRAPTPKNLALLPDAGPVVPTIVYTGPTRSPAQVDALAALPEAADPAPKKAKKKAAKAGAKAAAATPAADGAPGVTGQAKTGKPSGSNIHYTPSSSSASAVNPASGTAQKKPKPPTPAPAQ